ncbi:lipopolysaccharide biosynthesis protein [Neobacillus vireti]|uniref:Polysaccharide biosynthesis protein n=1 Tax=Neobacillus vireti LMG 21834 TaxID=1131730 RepID=A0AB94IQD6_9BACI|nr:lipopolysaccharide biosynthesis protein [Neobacillus vireti]ETI69198.1 polysaccharide biosynthesis protein [Neobacillus vireti LMG 21834]KLT15570.1 polysaccharide biosynthesis protein [Neobacillus vireti]
MEDNKLKSKVLISLFWKMMESGGVQGVQFVVQIVLARLLLPEDYGNIALVSIFIVLGNVFVQRGFNTALIQKKDTDEVDFSSAFYLSLFTAGSLYLVLFFISPLIADFFQASNLVEILRVLAVMLFFGAVNSIQGAYIAKKMLFRKLFFSSVGAILVSGTLGIVTAYSGWGVWALVIQQLANQILTTIILWFTVKWRPKLLFSKKRVKSLFSYGWKLLVASLIDVLEKDVRSLIIGKFYSPAMLGVYNRGEQFPKLIVNNINGPIQSVMLPALSSQQHNKVKVKNMVRRSITTCSFIVFPSMVGLAVIAEPLTKILLTEKWLPSVPFLVIFSASYALWPIHTANLQAINALGRSDIFLKLEIAKKIIGLIVLLASLPFGVYAIALGSLLSGIISTFVNAYPNNKLLDYNYKEQWKDIMPSLLLSLAVGGAIYNIRIFSMGDLLTIILQIFSEGILYLGLAKLFKMESYKYIVSTGKEFLKNR